MIWKYKASLIMLRTKADTWRKRETCLERKVQPNKQGNGSSYLALGISYASAGASTDVCMDNEYDSIAKFQIKTRNIFFVSFNEH